MSGDMIATISGLIVGGLALMIVGFAAVVFWKAWQKGARRKHSGVSPDKAARAKARPGKPRRK